MIRLQTSTNMGGDGESDFSLIRVPRNAQASFLRGLDETLMTFLKVLELSGIIRLKD